MEEKIKASELRLGNYVLDKVNGLSTVSQLGSSINKDYIGAKSIKGNYWGNNHLPVPLTEQWLLDFGAIKRPMTFDFELNGYTILQMSICNDKGKGEYYAMIRQEDEMVSIPKRTFYVHQLQNLYFCLTGKELTLKEKTKTIDNIQK